ncbi:hypothetical protein BaRGS_00017581 [Batillaria attramentaria]|uniref:Uncharacterized protein n=1 Tax=Batillaria attramentaria TaxID=370345 RepID=A0ABD0KVA5_9CAEN
MPDGQIFIRTRESKRSKSISWASLDGQSHSNGKTQETEQKCQGTSCPNGNTTKINLKMSRGCTHPSRQSKRKQVPGGQRQQQDKNTHCKHTHHSRRTKRKQEVSKGRRREMDKHTHRNSKTNRKQQVSSGQRQQMDKNTHRNRKTKRKQQLSYGQRQQIDKHTHPNCKTERKQVAYGQRQQMAKHTLT